MTVDNTMAGLTREEGGAGSTLQLPRVAVFGALLEHWRAFLGLAILTPIVLLAVISPALPLPGFLETDVSSSFLRPSLEHPFGTDKLGRDILSRTLAGARISLTVGFSVPR